MQQDILIIGVLFPAIPLMMVNFGNRYIVLANLIRHLHDEVIRDNVSPKDAERFLLQINRLPDRLRLIGIIQSCAAIPFVLALGAMIAAYFDERVVSSILFLGSILLMMGSMLLFTREIQIANTALDVHLSDLESHQEWEKYSNPTAAAAPRRRAKQEQEPLISWPSSAPSLPSTREPPVRAPSCSMRLASFWPSNRPNSHRSSRTMDGLNMIPRPSGRPA